MKGLNVVPKWIIQAAINIVNKAIENSHVKISVNPFTGSATIKFVKEFD